MLRNYFLSPDDNQGGGSGDRTNSDGSTGSKSQALTKEEIVSLIQEEQNKFAGGFTKKITKKISDIVEESINGEDSPIMQRLNEIDQKSKKANVNNSGKEKQAQDDADQGENPLLSEVDKLKKIVNDREQRLKQIEADQLNKSRKETIVNNLKELGFKHPEKEYHYLQAQGKINWDDDGKPITKDKNDMDISFIDYLKNDYAKSGDADLVSQGREGSGSGMGERGFSGSNNSGNNNNQGGFVVNPSKAYENFNKLLS